MNRLLITGATGFLGLPCVARAIESQFAVYALARTCREPLMTATAPSSRAGKWTTTPREPGARARDNFSLARAPGFCGEQPSKSQALFHAVDLFDGNQVSRVFAMVRPTHLLHLAWITTPGVYWTSPENRAWVESSRRLLNAFAECGGKRAVIAGTCAEYDWTAGGRCHEFETPIQPTTLYGKCKSELLAWTHEYGQGTGVSIAWARLFFLYGPREHPARLVSSVARSLLAGEPADCSAGLQQRDFLHVADLADALVTLVDSNVTGPINVGSGEPVEVRRVIESVGQLCRRSNLIRLGARPTPASEPAVLVADVGRLRDELGWRPRIDLEEGLKETVAWWRIQRAA